MDFDAVADELYGLDHEEFISVRERRVEQARGEGNRGLAERIHRLRKPTSAAALVNRLARRRPDDIAALTDLGDELRRAHAEFAGDRLRTLSRRRHDLVRTLTDRARAFAGDRVSESVAREVAETLDAALADPETGSRVRAGRLSSAVRPADVFADTWVPSGTTPARDGTDRPRPEEHPRAATRQRSKKRQPDRDRPQDRDRLRDGEREDEREREQHRERERERERRRAEERRRRAEEVEARKTRDTARRELRAAEREETKARKRTEAARKAFEAADRVVSEKTSY